MALPHQVGLKITYDGTVKKLSDVTTKAKSNSITYTIRQGDTLWDLARKYYGSGTKENIIYDANKDILEKTAKKYGKRSAKQGKIIWIYPGTVITIPNVSGTTSTTKKAFVKTGTANSKLGSKIADQATAFSYTDVASGQSDSVSITLCDIEKEWLGNLMPKEGADIGVKLVLTNWNEEEKKETFNCGTFILDDFSYSGRPLSCVLGGVSVPTVDDFKTEERDKTWESTTIKEIASEIAKKYYISLYYDADTIKISEIEQSGQTDSAFLYSLCEKYGLAMKVYNKKIVIFDIVKYEQKKSVLTLKETDLKTWDYNRTIQGTYTGVTLEYTDPDSDDDEPIKVTIGSKGRMYKMNSQASSKYDAELQARAKVNAANRSIETMTATIRGNIGIVASQCVTIKGLGKANGKYYVDKAVHKVGSGYTTQLTLHKVQEAIGYKKAGGSSKGGTTHKVVSGDNLWNIAKKYYGNGTKQTIIYNANKDIIEATAKKYGRSSSKNGWWIYPGTVLTIPEV